MAGPYLIVMIRLYTNSGRPTTVMVANNGDWRKFASPRWCASTTVRNDDMNLPLVTERVKQLTNEWFGDEYVKAQRQACMDCMMDDLAEQIKEHPKYGKVKQ